MGKNKNFPNISGNNSRLIKPLIIGIAGAHSGSGKTTVACNILRNLKGWSAIKYTKTPLYSSIIDNPTILSEKGKDTAKMLKAGAEKVLWIQSPSGELSSLINIALNMLYNYSGIVIEGNSAVKAVNPDILVFVLSDTGKIKLGADVLMKKANIIIHNGINFPDSLLNKNKFLIEDVDGYVNCLKDLLSKMQ